MVAFAISVLRAILCQRPINLFRAAPRRRVIDVSAARHSKGGAFMLMYVGLCFGVTTNNKTNLEAFSCHYLIGNWIFGCPLEWNRTCGLAEIWGQTHLLLVLIHIGSEFGFIFNCGQSSNSDIDSFIVSQVTSDQPILSARHSKT